jgi:hypothetical protein
MLLLLRRPASLLLLIALTALTAVYGIVPATKYVGSDFPNYFTAARIVVNGGDIDRLYDDVWFQEQIRGYQVGSLGLGKFTPFPPVSALLLVPLTGLSALNALRVMTAISLLCGLACIVLLARVLSWRLLDAALLVLLSGYAIFSALRDGQPYIVVSLSCILGYYLRLRGRPLLAGISFGLFVPIKYFAVVYLVYFAVRKEGKLVLGGVIAALAVGLLGLVVLGWGIHAQFLSRVLGNHLLGKLGMQDPFTASFQSFDSLLRRLFVFDAAANPQPFLAYPALQILGTPIIKASLLAAAIAALVKLNRGRREAAAAPSLGIIGITTMLLAPATATYHFVLLWLPIGLLIEYFIEERAIAWAACILAVYALIGLFPYRMTQPFEGRGGLNVLAFPRLALLLLLFMVAVYFVWRRQDPLPKPT